MLEIDLEIHLEAVAIGVEFRPLVAVFNPDALLDPHELLGRVLFTNTHFLQQIDERMRTAVHYRDLGGINLDIEVVDAHPGQSGRQMFDGRHANTGFVHQSGTKHGITHLIGVGWQRDHRIQIGTQVNDPCVNRRRTERHSDFPARMQAHTGGLDTRFQGSLSNHGRIRFNSSNS